MNRYIIVKLLKNKRQRETIKVKNIYKKKRTFYTQHNKNNYTGLLNRNSTKLNIIT